MEIDEGGHHLACIDAVQDAARSWLAAAGVPVTSVEDLAAELFEEAVARSGIAARNAERDELELRELLEQTQRLVLAVALCASSADILDAAAREAPLLEFTGYALAVSEMDERFASKDAARLLAIFSMVQGNVPLDQALRAEAALHAAHGGNAAMYAMHAQKLARNRACSAILRGELAPEDAWHHVTAPDLDEDDEDAPRDTLLQCPKCKERRVSYVEKQTRSADEALTCFCTCRNPACRYRWKM